MQQGRSVSPLFVIARTIVNYGVWFVSVPAICLQFFGVLVALFSIYLLFLQWNPDATADVLKTVLTFFHIENFSYHGSLIGPFLSAYVVLSVVIAIVEPLLFWAFNIQWKWTAWKTLGLLTAFAAVTYGVFAIFAIVLHETLAASIFLFTITVIASTVAVGANALGTKIINLFR